MHSASHLQVKNKKILKAINNYISFKKKTIKNKFLQPSVGHVSFHAKTDYLDYIIEGSPYFVEKTLDLCWKKELTFLTNETSLRIKFKDLPSHNHIIIKLVLACLLNEELDYNLYFNSDIIEKESIESSKNVPSCEYNYAFHELSLKLNNQKLDFTLVLNKSHSNNDKKEKNNLIWGILDLDVKLLSCNERCKNCASSEEYDCTECKEGYFLEKLYKSSNKGICKKCHHSCLKCHGNEYDQCLECESGKLTIKIFNLNNFFRFSVYNIIF